MIITNTIEPYKELQTTEDLYYRNKPKINAKVEILLSTYNGEKYLKEQLNSLLTQECIENIKISIRDDGSTDGTCDILRSYEEKYHLNITYGTNLGVNFSMTELLKNADNDFDYFAFCDQDDVWDTGKILAAVLALDGLPEEDPLLWGCMEMLTDESLCAISLMPVPKYLGNFYNAIIQNKLAGHTQVFNRALRNILLKVPPEKMYLYDWVTYILASAFGKVLFDTNCLGLYRQHGKNVVGYELNAIAQIPRRFKRLTNGAFKQISTQMQYVYELFEDDLNTQYKNELNIFLKSRRNFIKRILYICNTKIKRNTRFESIQFRILYLLGVFGGRRNVFSGLKKEFNKTNEIIR